MPGLRTLINVALGHGARAEQRSGPRYRQPTVTLPYSAHNLQALDFHSAGPGERPLLAFIHGGAWQFGDKARRIEDLKAGFAHGEGWHFASLNFRLVPEVGVAAMACDVAAGVALLFAEAARLGIDRRRIVLMGHSSGAHLAALVASDPSLLGAHGLSPAALAGVIAIDGAAFDARAPSTGSRLLARRLVDPAFAGADLAALSPVCHLAGASGPFPPHLILAAQGARQSALLAAALRESGAACAVHEFTERGVLGHVRLSRRFGRPGFGPTEAARAWLRELIGRPVPQGNTR